jgi:hypothetical protein
MLSFCWVKYLQLYLLVDKKILGILDPQRYVLVVIHEQGDQGEILLWIVQALIRSEDNIEDAFHSLRDEIFNWRGWFQKNCLSLSSCFSRWFTFFLADWSRVWPLDYLNPFFELIKSPESSGKVTSAALQGIQRVLEQDLLGTLRESFIQGVHLLDSFVYFLQEIRMLGCQRLCKTLLRL